MSIAPRPLRRLLQTLILLSAAFAVAAHAVVQFRAAESGIANASTGSITLTGHGALTAKSNGSVTPLLPAHAAGDLLICLAESRGDTALSSPTSGWSRLYALESGNDQRAALFWRFAASSNETRPRIDGGNELIARCSAFRGVDPAASINYAQQSANNQSYVRTGTLTNVQTNATLLFAAHYNQDRALTIPGGWQEGYRSRTSNPSLALLYRTWPGGGSAGPFQATLDGDARSHGALIELRPAPVTSTVLTINKPAGTSASDVLVAAIAAAPNTTITPPPGWTLIANTPQTAINPSRTITYYRVATASEPASYTWTLGSGAGMAGAGAIAAFSGVDTSVPIDASAATVTASSLSHTTPSITTTQNDGMLVTAHVLASSVTFSTPAGMTNAAAVASLAVPNANGVSLTFNYEARPNAGSTGTRTATASANGDAGAAHAIALKAAPLACYRDDFNRVSPGSSWALSRSGGSFTPSLVGNRLRLTDSTNNVATLATLQQLFPGAGNRVEIAFDYLAYNGTGADGIAVVLSDSAVAPAPGGYGGSLGYAPKDAIPGFAGGWLGIGVDEYGNFSATEGNKTGGPGQRPDSVSIRGSGAGTSGYGYHTGTGTLTPGVDAAASATPAPGHRYRIIVDHSNGVNAWVSVERDTGTGYQTLIAPYDAKAQMNQGSVPANWMLSFTGSTGGSTNIHELDNLQICATSQYSAPPIHHFDIDTGGTYGSNCEPQAIVITARDASGNTLTSYTGTVSITTSTNIGNWSLASGGGTLDNGASNDGAATYTFAAGDNGVATLNLLHAAQGTVIVSVVDTVLGSTLSTTTPILFDDDNFILTVPDALGTVPVAGRDHQIRIERRNNCGTTNTNGNINLAMWLTPDASHPAGALAATINGVALPFTEPGNNNVTLSFAAGIADFMLATTDVGKYVLNVREFSRRGSSPTLTVRPWLHLAVPGNPAGAGPADALFGSAAPVNSVITAGSDFTGTVRGVLWQSADDADNDGIPSTNANLADNATAPSYLWDTTLSAIAPITPAGGVVGVLNNGDVMAADFAGGSASRNTLQYTEVGSFTLQAKALDYLNTAGLSLSTAIGPIGRFRPHDFGVSYNAPKFNTSCGSGAGFTYVGQNFSYETVPVLTVTARNALGGTTQNYTAAGGWFKLDTADLSGKAYTAQTGTLDTGLIAPGSDPVIAGSGAGVATLTFTDGGGIRFVRTDPLAPFDAEISLAINVQDDEGVAFAGNPARFGAPTAGNGIAFTQGKQMRFGRLRILNALGSERLALPIPMRVEYWTGNGFATNTLDGCTTLPRATVAMDAWRANLNACETAFGASSISFTNGTALPTLAAPGNTNDGSVDLRATLGAAPASGPFRNYCNGAALTAVGSGALTHLRGRWNDAIDGDGDPATRYDDDPIARAAFGVYGPDKASKRMIYSRENY